MKTIALTVLHYGKPYLAYAMLSLVDYVDEYWVLYSPAPSHNGGRAALPCPDTEGDLHDLASIVAGRKLRWHRGDWHFEGQQRDEIFKLCPDADVILVADYDEIWPGELVKAVLNYSGTVQYDAPARGLRLPMIHYWRSFQRCVLHDPSLPVRVIYPRIDVKYGDRAAFTHKPPINHLGYAIPEVYMRYKWSGIHGHQNELRPGWLEDTFLPNKQTDCHPVGSEYWNPEQVDPMQFMPAFMKAHPFAMLEVIR